MTLEERILITSILLHHIYIVLLNTSSVHGLPVPDKRLWTGFLVIFLLILMYYYLQNPASTWYEKALYMAVFLALTGSILRVVGFSVELVSYSLLLLIIAILTTIPLILHQHYQIRVFLLAVYILEILQLIAQVFNIANITPIVGPIVELIILIGLIYYNYSLGFMYDELFLVIIATIIGWYLGDLVASLDVPNLIASTLFTQTLAVDQFTVVAGIGPKFFLSLHFAEVFNLLMIQLLAKRSPRAIAIILAGLDMTYPPLMAFRALAILAFLRDTLNSESEKNSTKKASSTVMSTPSS